MRQAHGRHGAGPGVFLGALCLGLVAVGAIGLGGESGAAEMKLRPGLELPNLLRQGRFRNAPANQRPPGSGWVVYLFSPRSAVSAKNSDQALAVARSLPQDWAFLAVATETDGLLPFMERQRFRVPLISEVPAGELSAYGPSTRPRTFILGPDWRLIEEMDGLYNGEVARRLAHRLGPAVKLALGGGAAVDGPKPPPGLPAGLCLDSLQRPSSPGAGIVAFGVRFECEKDGTWVSLP